MLGYLQLAPGSSIQEMAIPPDWIGKSLLEIAPREKLGIQVVGVRCALSDTVTVPPDPLAPLKDSDAANATSIDDLKGLNIGVQIGTTSLDAVNDVIQPDNDPQVFDTSNDVVTALKQGKVDAIVVDVPTGFFLTATEIPEATLAAQFAAPGGDEWGALLEKDSSLTACVSAAIDDLRDSGELAEIEQEWISDKTNAPVLE